jgi:RHS repeat-associated protein
MDQGGVGVPAAVRRQYVWSPYGEAIYADEIPATQPEPLPINRIGHQGLFFYRLDGTPDGVAGGPDALAPGAVGLYYNRNRWYSPAMGRFTSMDPNATALPLVDSVISLDAMAQYDSSLNLHECSASNPLSRSDPIGLEWHHLYPQYLGGCSDGPGIWLDEAEHDIFHNFLKGLLGDGDYECQREVWKGLSDETRKNYLKLAADAAGVDIGSSKFEQALELAYRSAKTHGVKVEWAKIKPGNFVQVPRKTNGGPRALVEAKIPGANKAVAIATGLAIAGAVLDASRVLDILNNPGMNSAFVELAKSTRRARATGGLSLWDEAFSLMDFCELTGEPISAELAWDAWSGHQ